MNAIHATKKLNERELELVIPPEASWHRDYDDTAFIYIGGLPLDLSEGDVITIFSQYGEPVFINLVRDKDTGKSKGFCFLKYEDQRSCTLAVDNLGGATVLGRVLRVDHTRYKQKDDEEIYDNTMGGSSAGNVGGAADTESEADEEPRRPLLKEEVELARLLEEEEDDDPMKAYLIEQKREEVARAKAKLEKLELKAMKQRDRRARDEHAGGRRHRKRRENASDEDDRRHGRGREDFSDDDDRRRRHKGEDGSNDHGRRHGRRMEDTPLDDKRRRERRQDVRKKHSHRSRSRSRSKSPRRERGRELSTTPVFDEA